MNPNPCKMLWLAALALVLGVAAPTAHASPCGGDSGDSDSGGSDSGDDDDSDWYSSDSSSSSEPACVQTTDIVGRAECSRFGTWDASFRPRFQISLGVSSRGARMNGMSFAGRAEHEQTLAYRVESEDIGGEQALRAVTFDARITGSIARYGYFGVEGAVGGGGLGGARMVDRGDLTVQADSAMYLSAGAVAGFAVPVTDGFSIGAEAAAGRRWSMVSVTTRHFECVDDSDVIDGQWYAMPRVVATRWMSPHFSISAHLGSDALRDGELSAGVMLTGHGRGFDGVHAR